MYHVYYQEVSILPHMAKALLQLFCLFQKFALFLSGFRTCAEQNISQNQVRRCFITTKVYQYLGRLYLQSLRFSIINKLQKQSCCMVLGNMMCLVIIHLLLHLVFDLKQWELLTNIGVLECTLVSIIQLFQCMEEKVNCLFLNIHVLKNKFVCSRSNDA